MAFRDVPVSASRLLVSASDLFERRPDKGWSLTDCISFVVITDRGLTEALTGDHDFQQAGFRALLRRDSWGGLGHSDGIRR